MSSELSVDVLDERTKTLVRKFDEHVEEDKKSFNSVFKALEAVKIAQAKSGVVIAAIVIMSQMVVGAWVKGLF